MFGSSRRTFLTAAIVLFLFALGASGADTLRVDPRFPSYTPVEGVSGHIKSVGSDTMNNLMALWAERFKRFYPNVAVEIEGKGSSTAPPALITGASTFGPMSRAMKDKEVDAFEKRFGYKPSRVRTAIDMLAVYVNKDNPIAKKGLTLQQVDAVFSKTRKGGYPAAITRWGQLGLTGEWADKPIVLYGRNSASGTYGYFKKHALFKGDYKDTVKEQPGSASVVQSVARDRYGIGYSGIGYRTADVAVVPLAHDAKERPVAPSMATVSQYPLARFLYLYFNRKPGAPLDPLRREFLKLVFSRDGQEVVIKDGYLPVSARIAAADTAAVGIEIPLRKGKAKSVR